MNQQSCECVLPPQLHNANWTLGRITSTKAGTAWRPTRLWRSPQTFRPAAGLVCCGRPSQVRVHNTYHRCVRGQLVGGQPVMGRLPQKSHGPTPSPSRTARNEISGSMNHLRRSTVPLCVAFCACPWALFRHGDNGVRFVVKWSKGCARSAQRQCACGALSPQYCGRGRYVRWGAMTPLNCEGGPTGDNGCMQVSAQNH